MQLPKRAYAQIDLDAICKNIQNTMQKVGAKTKVMAVIKTDAYGHGAIPVARTLERIGTHAFAVATAEEALELRQAGITAPILILGYVFAEDFPHLLQNNITLTVFQPETAKALSECAQSLRVCAKIHIKIDTGMGRIGFLPNEESLAEIEKIAELPCLSLDGIFTHFACADEADKSSCNRQKQCFLDFLQKLELRGVQVPCKHMCNSAGIIEFSDGFLNMVRCGILTYGLYPSEEVQKENFKLFPALQLKSHISFVKTVGKGFTVSYGSTYTTEKEKTVIATVPVGYGDGYPRALSNIGRVLIHGQFAPIIGRVCMDQFMVDVTDISNVQSGDIVTLIGTDGQNRISVEELADRAHSFNYELCCNINKRVPRVYQQNGELQESIE